MGVTVQRHFRGLSGINTSLYEQSCFGLANYMDFLLKMDASKEGLGAVLSRNR